MPNVIRRASSVLMGVVSSVGALLGQWVVLSTASSNHRNFQPLSSALVISRVIVLPPSLARCKTREPNGSGAVHAYQRSAAPRKVPVKVLTSGQIKASKEEVRTRVRNPTI